MQVQMVLLWQSRQYDFFPPSLIAEFSTPYVQKVREAVEDDNFVVIYHNCGNVVPLMDNIKEMNALGYSFGNAIDIEETLKVMPEEIQLSNDKEFQEFYMEYMYFE